MLFLLACLWLFLQLSRHRLNSLFARLGSHFNIHLTPFSLHLSTTHPTLLSLPAGLVDRLPKLQRHRRSKDGADEQRRRRLGAYWDAGAILSVVGGVLAQVVLLFAAGKALRALWTLLIGSAGATEAALRIVKRVPVDLSPLPLPSANGGGPATDNLLLRPLIPSLSSLPLLVSALAVSQGWHELGHALAAASEQIPLHSFGVHLIFLVLPTPYVGVSSSPASDSLPLTSSDSFPPTLSPQTELRIASAGVWHNVLMLAGTWVLSSQGGDWGRGVLEGVGAIERREEGVVVVEVDPHSPLSSHLPRGALITHLNDLELDSSSSPSGSTAKAWEEFLRLSPGEQEREDPYKNMGWCLNEGVFNALAEEGEECCPSPGETEGEDGPKFCFTASSSSTSSSSSQGLRACLNPLPYLPSFPSSSASTPPPARCIDSSSCASSHPGTLCARIAPEEKVLRIGVKGKGEKGERRTVLWQGEREGVWREVRVTDFEPQYCFIPLGSEGALERFLGAIISLSLSLIFFNLLLLPHLDGSHILSSFLPSLSSLSPSSLPLTSSRAPSPCLGDAGLLDQALRWVGRIGWVREAAERRDRTERWARRWTIGVGGIALTATMLVEVGTWMRG